MGKTYRREKSPDRRPSRLNTHRDLPDYMDLSEETEDYPYDEDEGREYYGKRIHSDEEAMGRQQSKQANQKNSKERRG